MFIRSSSTTGLEGFVEVEWDEEGHLDLESSPAARISLAVSRLSSGNRLEESQRCRSESMPGVIPPSKGCCTSMEAIEGSDGTYDVSGDITFRGVSKRHDDRMTIEKIGDESMRLAGKSRFDIREFGMEPPRMLMLPVEPEVDIRVELQSPRRWADRRTSWRSPCCNSIVDAVERRAGDRKVAKVRVRVGRLLHVHPEAFEQSFSIAAHGTVAEDAGAELVLLPVGARCVGCGQVWEAEEVPVACPKCAAVDIELVGGDRCYSNRSRVPRIERIRGAPCASAYRDNWSN